MHIFRQNLCQQNICLKRCNLLYFCGGIVPLNHRFIGQSANQKKSISNKSSKCIIIRRYFFQKAVKEMAEDVQKNGHFLSQGFIFITLKM